MRTSRQLRKVSVVVLIVWARIARVEVKGLTNGVILFWRLGLAKSQAFGPSSKQFWGNTSGNTKTQGENGTRFSHE